MELKTYQKQVIADLSRYMALLDEAKDSSQAFKLFWEEKGIPVGLGGVPAYQHILPGIPTICLKVPTGGGKTFLACHAIKPVFDQLPPTKTRAVVWLVPSDAILTQTLAALRNPYHPYRQRINADFSSRVEVYTKEELLNGQNFNMTAISEQLSVMVLSYDSFRGKKEALKAKQENSNLAPIAKALGTPDFPVEDADETALIQVINQLSPLVIVDESHHARSKLSKEMLQNFNPCFVLDLTATPTKESNILCYVDAVQLKKESMVKLPVIVYNRKSQQDVLADAIDLRNHLEQLAKIEEKNSQLYIRPIVLFQAQPKISEDSTTFENLRDKLIEAGIPAEQIAIKTAKIDELKNKNLLRSDCPIRYIITINALREGWDCPFAYILASLANRTSKIEVEQIVGRILRQPYTRKHSQPPLNLSYVLTNSNDFKSTLDNIVVGLNGAGFSEKDYRLAEELALPKVQENAKWQQPELKPEPDEFAEIDTYALKEKVQAWQYDGKTVAEQNTAVDKMLDTAVKEQENFESYLQNSGNTDLNVPQEIKEKMSYFGIQPQFAEEVSKIRLPQFFIKRPPNIFEEEITVPLKKESLSKTFSLKGQPYLIDFSKADDEMTRIDIDEQSGSTPKVFKMSEKEQLYIKQYLSDQSPEKRIKTCKAIIQNQVGKIDQVDDKELRNYVNLVVEQMDNDTLSALEKAPQAFANRIKKYIEDLLEKHYEKEFNRLIETGEITCQPNWDFPEKIAPLHYTKAYGKSLYQAEETVNNFEHSLILELTSLPNVKWWHRNLARTGFCINGFINHYPDFIVRTSSGKILLVETKGDHLNNEENRKKLLLSRRWQDKAGDNYRYYMVFQNKAPEMDGAKNISDFLNLLKDL